MSSKQKSKALDPSFNPFIGNDRDLVWAKLKSGKRTPISPEQKAVILEKLRINNKVIKN